MTNRLSINKTIVTAAALSSLMALSAHRHVRGEVVATTATLSTPSATENTFDVAVTVLGSTDTQVITYEGILRPVLDIDFSNIAAPVIQTLDFAGVTGDIQHSDATFTVALGSAVFTGIRGRLETLPGSIPSPVTGGNTYSTIGHELIAWMGTIDIIPSFGPMVVPQINLMNDTFRSSLGGVDDASVSLTLNNIAAGMATYDLELFTPLQMVTIATGDNTIDSAIEITITGDIVARSQITRPIPEPAAGILFLVGASVWAVVRRTR